MPAIRSTTVLSVRRGAHVAMGADGQVTIGQTVAKADAVKVRVLEGVGAGEAGVLAGFAGSTADAFALMDRFEGKLKDSPANLKRAAIELAKLWRTDRLLRRLESLLLVADLEQTLMISGQGDVIAPSDGIGSIGSGGPFAMAAARALVAHTALAPGDLVREALTVAAEICIYTNKRLTVLELGAQGLSNND